MTAPDFDRTADAYRRRIVVETTQPGVTVADLEDDFHHFVVTLRHDGERVVEVSCESERWPWATCPGAAVHLRALEGMPLSRRFTAAGTAEATPTPSCPVRGHRPIMEKVFASRLKKSHPQLILDT